jgi:cytoskeletal protein CcmA (bactofilin family)
MLMTTRFSRSAIVVGLRAVLIASALLVLVPIQAGAADVRQGGSVTIGPDQTITDDLYVFGGTVNVQGTVDGSVIAAGGNVTISGTVTRDVMAAGGMVDITGTVKGSVRAAGGTVTISGPVAEDVVASGGTLTLAESATVGRDLLLGAGNATVSGPVARNVTLGSGTVTLQSQVAGNVTGSVNQLTLANGARVGGNLDYTSEHNVVVASGASVQGSTTRHTPTDRQNAGGGFVGWLRALIGFFAFGLLIVLLFAGFSTRSVATIQRQPLPSAGIGLAVLVVTPVVGLLVFVLGLLIGGWWLGLLLFPVYILALCLGYVVAALALGLWIADRAGWKVHAVWALLAGLVVLAVIGLIPVLGGLVSLVAVIFGLGAASLTAIGRPPSGQAVATAAAA